MVLQGPAFAHHGTGQGRPVTATVWTPVPIDLYSHLYEVSNHGEIRSLDRYVIETPTGKRRFKKGKTITPKRSGNYLGVTLFDKPNSERIYIHRLVALAFIPNPEKKPCVNHKNRDKYDNRADNLEWVSYVENTAHAYASRDWSIPVPKGSANYSAKLDEETVKNLRLYWNPSISMDQIAKEHNVTRAAIYKVLRGLSWKHVTPERAINWPS
jgi:hypothetical protein